MARRASADDLTHKIAKDALSAMCAEFSVKVVASKLSRSPHTLKSVLCGSQRMSLEMCNMILRLTNEECSQPKATAAPAESLTQVAPEVKKLERRRKSSHFNTDRQNAKDINLWTGKLTKDQAARIQVIANYCAHRAVKGLHHINGYSVEDVAQAGVLACIERAKNWKPSKGKFNTYFNIVADSGVKDFIRSSDHLSRGERTRTKEENGKETKRPIYIEDIRKPHGNFSAHDETEAFEIPFEDKNFDKASDEQLLDAIIGEANLDEDESLVIDMCRNDIPQRDIGLLFGVTESRACQVVLAITEKLIAAKNRLLAREKE